jgi:hypothetical protein
VIRTAIRLHYGMLYSSDLKAGSYEHVILNGFDSFCNMLPKCEAPTADSCSGPFDVAPAPTLRFTYVIISSGYMHFSVTSKSTGQDLLSKHALHACAAESVTFAGEFFLDTTLLDDGRFTLVIDNNSGTFAPPKDRLYHLQMLFVLNFGCDESRILALDRSDPRLQELFEANHVE